MGETDVMSTAELPAISAPARRALATIGVTRLADLIGHSRADLLAIHGFGPKALTMVEAELRAHGLPLPR